MVPALSLWLPVLLSAVAVFLASSIIHLALSCHRSEFSQRKSLVLWFLNCVLVGLFAAYLAGWALEPGAGFLAVFRFVGTAAFGGYALAWLQNSIWYGRSWISTFKFLAEGFLYALLTAGIFGWLWPA